MERVGRQIAAGHVTSGVYRAVRIGRLSLLIGQLEPDAWWPFHLPGRQITSYETFERELAMAVHAPAVDGAAPLADLSWLARPRRGYCLVWSQPERFARKDPAGFARALADLSTIAADYRGRRRLVVLLTGTHAFLETLKEIPALRAPRFELPRPPATWEQLLRQTLPLPVRDEIPPAGARLRLIGGGPGQVIADLTGEGIYIAEYAIRWDSHTPVVDPRPGLLLRWDELGGAPASGAERVIDAIEATRRKRLARFRTCHLCGMDGPPEWMGGDTCHGCMERRQGVVF